jgi:hypothetical protein
MGVESVKVMAAVLPVSPWREERLRQVSHVSLTDRAVPPVTTVAWDVRGEPGWLPGLEVFGVAVELVADMATTAPSTATATANTNHHKRLTRLGAG